MAQLAGMIVTLCLKAFLRAGWAAAFCNRQDLAGTLRCGEGSGCSDFMSSGGHRDPRPSELTRTITMMGHAYGCRLAFPTVDKVCVFFCNICTASIFPLNSPLCPLNLHSGHLPACNHSALNKLRT